MLLFRACSHFDIHVSISTSINISMRKIRKVCVNRGYISISISTRNGTFSIFLCLCLGVCNKIKLTIDNWAKFSEQP